MRDIQDNFRCLCSRLVRRNLQPLCLALAILCVGFALWSLRLPAIRQIPPLINQAAITSVVLVGIRVLLQFWRPPERWAHPFAVLCLGLGLVNLLLCQYAIPGPDTLPWLAMWIISAGFLLLSWSWFIVTLLLALIGAALAWPFPAPGTWSYGLTLLTATALAGAIHATRWGTVRQQAIQEADNEDQRIQDLLLIGPAFEGVAVCQQETIVGVNPTLGRLFKYSNEELLGKSLLELIEPESRSLIADRVRLGNFDPFEAKGLRQDGTQVDIELFCKNLPLKDRQLIVCSIRDISQRKQAAIASQQEKQRLEDQNQRLTALAILESTLGIPDSQQALLDQIVQIAADLLPASGGACLLLWDAGSAAFYVGASTFPQESIVTGSSGAFQEASAARWILAHQESLLVSQVGGDALHITQLFPGMAIQAYAGVPMISEGRVIGILFVLEKQSRSYSQEDQLLLQSLSSRAVLGFLLGRLNEQLQRANQRGETLQAERQAARSEAEQLRQSLEESRRILELRQAELDATLHESTKAKKALETASRVKEKFLAIVSHELRTPMNGILGMASLLETAGLPLEQHQNVVAVRTSAESLLRTINGILDYSQLESGQPVLSSVPFSVHSLLRDLIGGLTAQARGTKNRILYDVSPDVPELIEGDAERVRQLLAILIGNAVKFTQQGEISVHVTREVDEDPRQVRLKFTVFDTGIGMPEESRRRLFQPFTQMDDSSSRKFGGTGMGLAIAQQITDLFHGTIGVESQPNQGSIFWVVLSFKNLARLPRPHE
jgi:PAS domain S-box-containing protein